MELQNLKPRKINVVALFSAFKDKGSSRRITPYRFTTESGDEYEIGLIRRVYQDRVGDSLHIHFVVKTRCDRYFDIVYDSKKVMWSLVVEIEEYLFFSQ